MMLPIIGPLLRLATSQSVSKGVRGCVVEEQTSLGSFILFRTSSPQNTFQLQTSRQYYGLLAHQKKLVPQQVYSGGVGKKIAFPFSTSVHAAHTSGYNG